MVWELCLVVADSLELCLVVAASHWFVIIHTQIYGPFHGATIHENSTTMVLYGYNWAW
jgi:hypothetical protein